MKHSARKIKTATFAILYDGKDTGKTIKRDGVGFYVVGFEHTHFDGLGAVLVAMDEGFAGQY